MVRMVVVLESKHFSSILKQGGGKPTLYHTCIYNIDNYAWKNEILYS